MINHEYRIHYMKTFENSVRNHQLPSYVFSCQIKIRLYTHIESPSKKRIAHCNQVEPFQSAPFLSSAATARPWARIKRVVFTWAGKRWRFECLSVFLQAAAFVFHRQHFEIQDTNSAELAAKVARPSSSISFSLKWHDHISGNNHM